MKALDEERDAYLLGLMRVLFGVLLCFQVWARFDELDYFGYFGSFFHLALVPEAWVPSLGTYHVLLALEAFGAALAVVGWFGREGLFVGSSIGIFLMLCDRLQYHNNRFALLLFCLLVAVAPSDRSFLLYRGRAHALPVASRSAPSLPRMLIKFQVSLLYLSSGGGKALDPDWRSGQTMLLRFQRGFEEAAHAGAASPRFIVDFFTSHAIASLGSKLAISLELGLAFALWFRRTRVFALWGGAVFHLLIQASASVELFSFLMGAAYIAFVTPEVRERTLLVDSKHALGRTLKTLVPLFDWFARFQIEELSPAEAGSASVVVVGRGGGAGRTGRGDGRDEARGRAVPAALARALPAFFVAWPLLALFARGRASATTRTPGVGSPAGPG
jgi:hypothetical protein